MCSKIDDGNRALRVGIASPREMRERLLAAARGEYRPAPDEPKLWMAPEIHVMRSANEFTHVAFAAWLDKHRSIQKDPRMNEGATLAHEFEKYILPRHSAEVREWWNMRDGSPVAGAWNFYFGRYPKLGDALLRIAAFREGTMREP